MSRLKFVAIACVLLTSSVGCFQSRWAGYGGGCCNPGYAAPGGFAPQGGGGYYSPTGMSVPMNGPTAYYTPTIYGQSVPTTAFAPMDPLPTY